MPRTNCSKCSKTFFRYKTHKYGTFCSAACSPKTVPRDIPKCSVCAAVIPDERIRRRAKTCCKLCGELHAKRRNQEYFTRYRQKNKNKIVRKYYMNKWAGRSLRCIPEHAEQAMSAAIDIIQLSNSTCFIDIEDRGGDSQSWCRYYAYFWFRGDRVCGVYGDTINRVVGHVKGYVKQHCPEKLVPAAYKLLWETKPKVGITYA